jgi:enterochelin esterase family protein
LAGPALAGCGDFLARAAFSGGGWDFDPRTSYGGVFADPGAPNRRIRLLWLGCGTEDRGYASGKSFHEALTAAGIRHVWVEGPGSHEWQVWRKHLFDLAPRLFQDQ